MSRIVAELPPSRPSYFWWLLINVLALCFAVISWFFCLHLFGNPELPRNYRILAKIGRIPVLKRFTVSEVPHGSLLPPKELYQKFFNNSESRLVHLNALLLRNYLTNFDESSLVTYVEGDFQIMKVRPLKKGEFMDSGIAVQAQAMVKPDDFTKPVLYPVWIEYIFPTEQEEMARLFKVGEILSVQKSPHCAVVLHVAKYPPQEESGLLFSVVPIAYGSYAVGEAGSFELDPPNLLHLARAFPIFKQEESER